MKREKFQSPIYLACKAVGLRWFALALLLRHRDEVKFKRLYPRLYRASELFALLSAYFSMGFSVFMLIVAFTGYGSPASSINIVLWILILMISWRVKVYVDKPSNKRFVALLTLLPAFARRVA